MVFLPLELSLWFKLIWVLACEHMSKAILFFRVLHTIFKKINESTVMDGFNHLCA